MSVRTLRWRGGWARIAPWRHHADLAHLTVGSARPPSPSDVERCLALLRGSGYEAVVTNALSVADTLPFVDAGFAVRERLHLLSHDLDNLRSSTSRTRRARRSDRSEILALDATAFDGFWRLDGDGFSDAVRATPVSRVRVTTSVSETVAGYAVTGRAGRHGYLQRVAVHPAARKRGLGRTL